MRNFKRTRRSSSLLLCTLITSWIGFNSAAQEIEEVPNPARFWIGNYLEAIKLDGFGPTVHARNVYHLSALLYDTWTLYNPEKGKSCFIGNVVNDFNFEVNEFNFPQNRDSAMYITMHYAAFRFLKLKFGSYSSKVRVMDNFIFGFEELGLNSSYSSTDYSSGNPAALGNYLGELMFEFGLSENAGDEDGYERDFVSVNGALHPEIPGCASLVNPNRWQPIAIRSYIDKKGWDRTLKEWNYLLILPFDAFLTPHWGEMTPFGMDETIKKVFENDGQEFIVFIDPGSPPTTGVGASQEEIDFYRWNFELVALWSGCLDPSDTTMVNISPAFKADAPDLLPTTAAEYKSFYHRYTLRTAVPSKVKKNPVTGKEYADNLVKRGDYARAIAEFWVDGVNTYSPPGHWLKMLEEVSNHPSFERKWMGKGETLSPLEWDLKAHLTLSGALHDAAISAWSVKAYYDYIRPISAIRWMGEKGQCSDSLLPSYSQFGLDLIPGKIELVMENDPLAGVNGEHLHKMKIKAWRGPEAIEDMKIDVAGVDWILAENWWPYQRYSFTTPPFAGYVSGHSTFSIAAAEVLTKITGSPYFPEGLKEVTLKKNNFLEFERGPSETITLQWATYREAANETCLSRIWGGIHPPIDDTEGRKIGVKISELSLEKANSLFLQED